DRQRLSTRCPRRHRFERGALAAISLQQREPPREVPAEDSQQTLVPRPEIARALALEIQDPGQLAAGEQRDGSSAVNALQTGQRDLGGRSLAAAPADAVLDRGVHRAAARHTWDADDSSPLR